MKIIVISVILLLIHADMFSEDNFAGKYREMAIDYNYDLKSAQKNIEAAMALEKIASAGLKPSVTANANYKYTANPTELTLNLPMVDSPLSLQGQNTVCGAVLSVNQPIYTGSRLLATLRKAEYQNSYARNIADLLRNSVCYQTDVLYWTAVARNELISINKEYRNSMVSLVEIINQRVTMGLVNPQDLLMAEVKLNEAEYSLLQSENNFEIGRMALNSMIGINLTDSTAIEKVVPVVDNNNVVSDYEIVSPEIMAALDQIKIAKSNVKINNSKYMPQIHIGAEGSYGKPGYDFNPDPDTNYAVYAHMSVPIFEFGKRRYEKRYSKQQVGIAEDNLQKVADKINLETQTARIALSQALQRVDLVFSSLNKAKENENKTTNRYLEGETSVLDVIDAGIYRMNAEINYTQSKVNAQLSYIDLIKVLNLYGIDGNIISLQK